MKNIVEVIRLNDRKTRIYELTADMTEQIDAGRLVEVEFGNSTTTAKVTIGSRLIDDAAEALIREYAHFANDFRKVVSVYPVPAAVNWPDPLDPEDVDTTDDAATSDDE